MDDGRVHAGTKLPTILALGLLAAALLLLAVGGFVRFGDTSGFGSDQVLGLGVLAGCLALGGVLVSLVQRTARRTVGAALAAITVALVVGRFDEGFRFVWASDEGELLLFTVGLGLLSLALLMPNPSVQDPGGRPRLSAWARASAYLVVLVVATVTAFNAGVRHFERTECVGSDGDCDLGFLTGPLWAGITVLLLLAAVTVVELIAWRRRRPAAS